MRRSLILLITAGLLPVVALGGTFGAITLRNERRALERQAEIDADFAAALLALKLEETMRAVDMVAQSPMFDEEKPDWRRFESLAARLLVNQPGWRSISVADPDGRRLFDAPAPPGGRPGFVVEAESLRDTVARQTPVIGPITRGPGGKLAFAVRAPVVADGRTRYVISAVLGEEQLRRLLLFQPLPPGWIAAVIDQQGHAVTTAPADAPEPRRRAVERWKAIEGIRWSVRITAPAEAFDAPLRHAILIFTGAAALCLLLVLLLARLLAVELREARRRETNELQAQRMEALGRLTGGIAHDLNNLLTPVIGGLDMIARIASDERTRRYVAAATASADRARTLAARLLAFSRRQPLAPAPVDLSALIEGMSDLIAHSITQGILLDVRIAPDLAPAEADPRQLELAILNLIINARDAMPEGGRLTIRGLRPSPDQLKGLPPGDYVGIAVEDSGSGMDAATLKQAVEPFFTTKEGDRGTGLGLSMVHGFAAQSHGALQLVSTPGEGTIATIILPCSETPLTAPAAGRDDRPLPPGAVLLVEDNAAVRHSIAEILRDSGQEVIEVGSVEEALARLESGQVVDAVITDFAMPGRSGGELVRMIGERWPHLPVLLVTGFVSALDELPSGTRTLIKPFSRAELIRALAAARAAGGTGPIAGQTQD